MKTTLNEDNRLVQQIATAEDLYKQVYRSLCDQIAYLRKRNDELTKEYSERTQENEQLKCRIKQWKEEYERMSMEHTREIEALYTQMREAQEKPQAPTIKSLFKVGDKVGFIPNKNSNGRYDKNQIGVVTGIVSEERTNVQFPDDNPMESIGYDHYPNVDLERLPEDASEYIDE